MAKKKQKNTSRVCCYPVAEENGKYKACGIRAFSTFMLPSQTIEDGQIVPMEGVSSEAPFCRYHAHIAVTSNAFSILLREDQSAELLGPFSSINMIEAVLEAKEAYGKPETNEE